ncbi:MAG: FAD-dependent oxidoreductase [Chitinivibrionales bacterium]|nr:FAD-dependent oxidoreductase [Chitinivibrionales bacterium]
MEQVDITIIGAGVVGLAIARRLARSERDIVVVERHDGFGRETSSRNSEVIHAGLYYPSGSLKAQMCVAGNRLLYEYCEKRNIPFKKTGKLVVAGSTEEVDRVGAVYNQGLLNGVEGLCMLEGAEISRLEPHVAAQGGVLSKETGIVDTHALMKSLEREAGDKGAVVAYNCSVAGVSREKDGYSLDIKDVDGEHFAFRSRMVVNAAGVHADRIASMAGLDIDSCGYRIHPCKGEYFSVSNRHKGKLTHLVYPAPTQISLGLHAVLTLDGAIKMGPNAFYVDSLEYDVDPGHKEDFIRSAARFLPFISPDDLSPDMAGIRPKLQKPQEPSRDFIIAEESARALPGFVNLAGIESPGLTSALAIADYVENLLTPYFRKAG